MKGEGKGGRLDGAKIHHRNNFGPPWQNLIRLRGGGLVGNGKSVGTRREREGGLGILHAGTETRDSQMGK